jgi:HEAT repeat protein
VEPSADLNRHPRLLVAEACSIYGDEVVARWCADLLRGTVAHDDSALPSLAWVGGAHALRELRVGHTAERRQDYWPRTWAARALLYTWVDDAAPAVEAGLSDEAWRVRAMCAKVIYHREIGQAAELLELAASDPVARVRAAAVRALGRVGEAEGARAIRACLDDDDAAVRRQAESALNELSRRLDREL